MAIKRNLLASSVALLRLASTSLRPDPNTSRVLSRPPCPRAPPSSRRSLVPNSRVSSYSSDSGVTATCWNCGVPAAAAKSSSEPFLACGSCRSVQPVDDSVDYFEIFGLERAYDIKDDSLEAKYKNWQKKLHPDLVHTKSEREQTFAVEQSARVIDAYRTLGNSLSRALYLLQLEGVHVDEEQTLTDPDLLAEMMDIREAVEEASDYKALKQIESQIQTKLELWSTSFNEAFKARDFDNAISATQRMRYYERAIEEILKKS